MNRNLEADCRGFLVVRKFSKGMDGLRPGETLIVSGPARDNFYWPRHGSPLLSESGLGRCAKGRALFFSSLLKNFEPNVTHPALN